MRPGDVTTPQLCEMPDARDLLPCNPAGPPTLLLSLIDMHSTEGYQCMSSPSTAKPSVCMSSQLCKQLAFLRLLPWPLTLEEDQMRTSADVLADCWSAKLH
jgi:hypothetical protein